MSSDLSQSLTHPIVVSGFKLLHTADWHLGMGFPSFSEHDERALRRQRLCTVRDILSVAERHRVDAVVVAGDVFDSPEPGDAWWQGLAQALSERAWVDRPLFLLPGNHDPLTATSVWRDPRMRAALPAWVHVVDHDRFTFGFGDHAVLHAVPCRRAAGQQHLVEHLPARESGDERIRIGLLHGQVFAMAGVASNFPIDPALAATRGFDYIALGDTHALRVPTPPEPMLVYPGAPEPTRFGETEAGNVVVATFAGGRRSAVVQVEPVGHFAWVDRRVSSWSELLAVAGEDHRDSVLRLELDLALPADDHALAQGILDDLAGTEVSPGLVGILRLEGPGLRLDPSDILTKMGELPEQVRETVLRLQARIDTGDPDGLAHRALVHLYRLVQETQVSP